MVDGVLVEEGKSDVRQGRDQKGNKQLCHQGSILERVSDQALPYLHVYFFGEFFFLLHIIHACSPPYRFSSCIRAISL
ncbi:hypothetical protein SDC9_211597 [bioreactor metagenome]|uniref:Uncharacterized protein n=1 Tax=bioreactor metagenome TaxID=1076179 RepID=A0A645JJS9_9ZZZZ